MNLNKENGDLAHSSLLKLSVKLDVESLARRVLDTEKFRICSGSGIPGQHHYGNYGLIIHTWEVAQCCLTNSSLLSRDVNQQELFLAALFHDYGKIYDYSVGTSPSPDVNQFEAYDLMQSEIGDIWKKTKHNRRVHHISRSAIFWEQSCDVCEVAGDSDLRSNVLHAILSHHGQRDWGSPVAPDTQVAWLLHLCDGLSARLADCDTWDRIKK